MNFEMTMGMLLELELEPDNIYNDDARADFPGLAKSAQVSLASSHKPLEFGQKGSAKVATSGKSCYECNEGCICNSPCECMFKAGAYSKEMA